MHRSAANSLTDDEPMAEMNFIPLIDIALTLVIILMVTTAFIQRPGFSLRLPETRTREGAPETNKDLTIAIAADGAFYLDGQMRTPEELAVRLRAAALVDKNQRVLVKGDRAVAYAQVMAVMDSVRQAGLTRVVLPTEPAPAGDAAPTANVPAASVPAPLPSMPPALTTTSPGPSAPTPTPVPTPDPVARP
jgi:biopolymer transport protein ExbD